MVPRARVDAGVPVDGVVRDVELRARVPLRELRARRVVTDCVPALGELQSEVVGELPPEPVEVAGGPLDEFPVVRDIICLYELPDVG